MKYKLKHLVPNSCEEKNVGRLGKFYSSQERKKKHKQPE